MILSIIYLFPPISFQLKIIRIENSAKIETRKNDVPTPTLEMFEEKQLLAACTALREDIARNKLEIIALDQCLNTMSEVSFFFS